MSTSREAPCACVHRLLSSDQELRAQLKKAEEERDTAKDEVKEQGLWCLFVERVKIAAICRKAVCALKPHFFGQLVGFATCFYLP